MAAVAPLIAPGALALRPPESLMTLERLGALHATRLSFMRCLLRRMAAEGWQLSRPHFELDARGVGEAVYQVKGPKGRCSLAVFSHDLAPDKRSDRVIAEAWDATFALTREAPDQATLDRLKANVPRQEAGRCSANEWVLSRANKSVRLFDAVVAALAAGRQPQVAELVQVGYLMRTTAVYGNGKFGLADLANTIGEDSLFHRPFEAEMLAVYLIREFTFDLVNHVARARSPGTAVALATDRRRALGIGNSTGLGMAPFLVVHPALLHHWIAARETAVARVCAQPAATPEARAHFEGLLTRARVHVGEWHTADPRQSAAIEVLKAELGQLIAGLRAAPPWTAPQPWRAILERAQGCSHELQGLVESLILEPHGDLVDDLADHMAVREPRGLEPGANLASLKATIERHYPWALAMDFQDPANQHYFWYYSEEKEEPRLGRRGIEPGEELEMRVAIARDVQALHGVLSDPKLDLSMSVAAFLLAKPQWRFIAGRVQLIDAHPYGEVHDNLLAAHCIPVDLLRCKLSFFGAAKFDPKSDRWTRIAMYQGAPTFEELDPTSAEDWAFPAFLGQGSGVV
ncbi:MAG: hypothetical protein ACFCBW_05775 [Candidatus Competibacterales bacterium]